MRAIGFATYLAIGLFTVWRVRGGAANGRAAVNLFLIYTLAVSFGAGLLQRELWPFSTWPLIAAIHGPVAHKTRLVAVDAGGHERTVDFRAWQPFVYEELLAWVDKQLPLLSPPEQDEAGAYLVQLAERGREAARAGQPIGTFDRRLGSFRLPYFLLHPRAWTSPADAPADAFVGVRFYHETWNLEERRLDPGAFQRTLVYEYPRR